MKKSLVIFLHIGFWFCYLALIAVFLGAHYGDKDSIAEAKIEKAFEMMFFFAVLPSAIAFYTFYFYLFPYYLQKNKYIQFFIYGILVCVAAAFVGFGLLSKVVPMGSCVSKDDTAGTFFGIITFMSFISLISGIISLAIKGFVTWFEEVKLKEQLVQKNHEMELALVKSQLDPHFLFNTLNNIDVLILKNAEEASSYLNHLSDIMRFMLFETKTHEISLSQELEYLRKYIELQKIRTANTSYVSFEIKGDPNNKKIAPMVFISFVENAFKHTKNKKIEDAIKIEVVIENDFIIMRCENKYDADNQAESHGIGNILIKKRPDLIYPEKHILEVNNENGVYSVHLKIKHG